MSYIHSDLVVYNANSRGKYVGDCVKRSLSLAFGMDYEDVSNELNTIVKTHNTSKYNTMNTISWFLHDRGLEFKPVVEAIDNVTVQEFSDIHNQGTWLILSGSGNQGLKGISNHIVCIISGNIYDSWDSSNEIAIKYCNVPASLSGEFQSTAIDNIVDDIQQYCVEYFNSLLTKKMPYVEVDSIAVYKGDDQYTGKAVFRFHFIDTFYDELPYYFRTNYTFRNTFSFKINPKLSDNENVQKLKPKLKQRIYDYFYDHVWKEVKDWGIANSTNINPKFVGDKMDLAKCPEWARPLVTYFSDFGNSTYGSRFEVDMDPLPGDPRANDGKVHFYADTLTELKDQFRMYKESYSRYGYDY